MREKLETLPVSELREMAKAQGLKGTSAMRKAELVELLCNQAEKEQEAQAAKTVQEGKNPQESRGFRENSRGREPSVSYHGNGKNQENGRLGDARRNARPYERNGQGKPVQRAYAPHAAAQGQGNGASSYSQGTQLQQNVPQPAQPQAASGEERQIRGEVKNDATGLSNQDLLELDSGIEAQGILEVMPDGFGFIRCENFLPGENDVYVAPSQIRRFNLKTGDIICGNRRVKSATEKFAALLYVRTVNGYPLSSTERRPNFEDLTPIFPNERLHMETPGVRTSVAMRVLDLLAPIGKGQRGMIVSPPKAGKTTLLKQVAKAVTTNHPDMHLMILLIDERP